MARSKREATKPDAEQRNDRFRDRIVELRRVRCGDIEPHPMNPRTHSAKQLAAVTGLLVDVGKARPLVAFPADGLGPKGDFSRLMYADGHGRQVIDRNEVWPVTVTDLTMAEATEMLFADSTGEMGGYDPVKLDAAIHAVNTGCEELQAMLSDLWASVEADAVDDATPEADPQDAEPQTDRAAELMEKWGTAAGQLWLLNGGKHRLLIGDCRKPEDMARLCGGDKINVAFTSPPYASQRKYDESSGFKPIKPDEYVAWWEAVQSNVRKHLADDGSFFVNIKPHCEDGERVLYVFDLVLKMRRGWGWRFVEEYIWKHSGIPKVPAGRFKNQFEPIYQFASAVPKFNPDSVMIESDRSFRAAGRKRVSEAQGGRDSLEGVDYASGLAYPSNVVAVNVESHGGEHSNHSAAFPLALPSFFIRAFSDEGDLILDPFLGSGTTMIAAENHSRRAAGCEISAQYAGVILQRYSDAFPDQEIKQAQ
jgi:site-specific DNA-methyltransferase (adenine-specific)